MYIKAFDKKGKCLKKEVFLYEESVYQFLKDTYIPDMDICVLFDSNTGILIKLVYDINRGGIINE